MYYLRFDQRFKVQAMNGNVNPVTDAAALRFRFPWPDEDMTAPGAFGGDHERGVSLEGFQPPAEVEHATIQFQGHGGYLLSLPCPESGDVRDQMTRTIPGATLNGNPMRVHLNGYSGHVKLVQQRWTGEHLALILKCGGCGAKWRVSPEDAPKVIAALRAKAEDEEQRDHYARRENRKSTAGDFWRTIADRAAAGYKGTI